MSDPEPHRRRTVRVEFQGSLVVAERSLVVLLVERNARLPEQRRNVGAALLKSQEKLDCVFAEPLNRSRFFPPNSREQIVRCTNFTDIEFQPRFRSLLRSFRHSAKKIELITALGFISERRCDVDGIAAAYLSEDEVELSVRLVHLVAFEQAEVGTTEKVILSRRKSQRRSFHKEIRTEKTPESCTYQVHSNRKDCQILSKNFQPYQTICLTLTQRNFECQNNGSHESQTNLIVHDDLVGGRVQKCRLREEVAFALLVLLLVCHLDVVGGERVESKHLVLLEVGVVEAGVRT